MCFGIFSLVSALLSSSLLLPYLLLLAHLLFFHYCINDLRFHVLYSRDSLVFITSRAGVIFYVVRETTERFCLHAGNMQLSTQSAEWLYMRAVGCKLTPAYLSIYHVQ